MHIEQIYTGCLAQGAYYITSAGEAAIIDPLREIGPYVSRLQADDVKLKYIFETHFHADFVSGHLTLARETGAPIVYGPGANTSFEAIKAEDGQAFKVGNITLIALHTPGHTLESTCYLLRDEDGNDYALFSGDTLFLGDVGRPDLAQKANELTQQDLAGMLYDSLRNKIMLLAPEVLVYPAHGAGSACGKNMSSETVGSIGGQLEDNYALRQNMTREEFIAEVTDGLTTPPAYFPLNVRMNQEGYEDVEEVIARGTRPLDPTAFEELANSTGAIVLDVRGREEFAEAHIPRSIFIGIDGGFAPWVGALIADVHQPILLVSPQGREEEVITRLARVGFDQTLGYLEGGVERWVAEGNKVDSVSVVDAAALDPAVPTFDVRKPGEYAAGHLAFAKTAPLSALNQHLAELPRQQPFQLHCQSGYRSMIAASILKSRGIHNVVEVRGGWKALVQTELPRVSNESLAPST